MSHNIRYDFFLITRPILFLLSDAFWGHDEVREMGMDAYKKKYKTYYAEKGQTRIDECNSYVY